MRCEEHGITFESYQDYIEHMRCHIPKWQRADDEPRKEESAKTSGQELVGC
jgi:hypothetical protein